MSNLEYLLYLILLSITIVFLVIVYFYNMKNAKNFGLDRISDNSIFFQFLTRKNEKIVIDLEAEENMIKDNKIKVTLEEFKEEDELESKRAFPNDDSLLKLLFMGIKNAQEKWTMPIRNWSLTLSQLAIHFEGRLDDSLNL